MFVDLLFKNIYIFYIVNNGLNLRRKQNVHKRVDTQFGSSQDY